MRGNEWLKSLFRWSDPLARARLEGFLFGPPVWVVVTWLIMTFPGWKIAWEAETWFGIATAIGTVGASAAAAAGLWYSWHSERKARARAAWLASQPIAPLLRSIKNRFTFVAALKIHVNIEIDRLRSIKSRLEAMKSNLRGCREIVDSLGAANAIAIASFDPSLYRMISILDDSVKGLRSYIDSIEFLLHEDHDVGPIFEDGTINYCMLNVKHDVESGFDLIDKVFDRLSRIDRIV